MFVILVYFILILKSGSAIITKEGKVVNGVDVVEFVPFHVSIRITIRDLQQFGRGHNCGGSLITRKTVVTAAHCLYDRERLRNQFEMRVVMGTLNRFQINPQTQIQNIRTIIPHPKYQPETFENDIGLVILMSNVNINDEVSLIKLPYSQVKSGTKCVIYGWGATKFKSPMPALLQKGNISIYSTKECNSTDSYNGFIRDGMICAAGENEVGFIDSCQGDSGGGLICDNRLVGLASFGYQCGKSRAYPGVYTDVQFFQNWILQNVNSSVKPQIHSSLLGLIAIIVTYLEYSKRLLDEGSVTPCDEDSSYEMHLPTYADKAKLKLGKRFFLINLNAMVHALYLGLISIAAVPSILKVLMSTKKSSTVMTAYRRYKANAMHNQTLYQYPLVPGSKAWLSLAQVRRIHLTISKRSEKNGTGIISQKDMAITQFLFAGVHLYSPDKLGIIGTQEQFEAFNHMWRVFGYMLGIKDEYNLCGETWADTRSRIEAMKEACLVPSLQFPTEAYETEDRGERDLKVYPVMHYETVIYSLKRMLSVPGYHYFQSEAITKDSDNTKVFQQLSYYTRFRIFLNIIIYQYLSPIFIFRWTFNIMRIILGILDKYPVIAIYKFGKKNAYVEILKSSS
ncbi:unnamed protein product [Diamesa tonsa]